MHLVREANGPAPLVRFLDSYRAHRPGVAHDLVLLLKGFGSSSQAAPFMALASDVTDRSILVEDAGYDIGSYLVAAGRLEHRSVCMLNSFSLILTDDWLRLLADGHAAPGVGLAGTTGSWASPLTQTRYELGLGGLYAKAQSNRAQTLRRMRELAVMANAAEKDSVLLRKLHSAGSAARRPIDYPSFPNYHVRTNAFIVDRELLLTLATDRIQTKPDALRFESGRRSLTRRVEAAGLRAVVVGRDGRSFDREQWPLGRTFWQGEQENLMIADNQTESYRAGDRQLRAVLSAFAWGLQSDPSVPVVNRIQACDRSEIAP